jgi:hypothetical protein
VKSLDTVLENLGDLPPAVANANAPRLLEGRGARLETELGAHDLEVLALGAHPCPQGQIVTFLDGIPHAVGREVVEVIGEAIVTEENDLERVHDDESALDRP